MLANREAEVLDSFVNIDDAEKLEGLLGATIRDLGFGSYGYLGFRAPVTEESIFVASNYPDEWTEHYRSQRYVFSDPMITSAKRARLPVYWKALREDPHLSKGQVKILNEGADFGILHGLTVPVHGPNGEFAQLSLSSDAGPNELNSLWQHKSYFLHLIGLYYHAALWNNVIKDIPEDIPVLSPREAEVLTWSARGKTIWEVSEILNIGEKTALTHLKRCFEKLGTFNKPHAVAKACVKGLIVP